MNEARIAPVVEEVAEDATEVVAKETTEVVAKETIDDFAEQAAKETKGSSEEE